MITIKKEVPEFRKSQKYPEAKGWVDKKCVIVEFPGCSYQWLPTYKEIADIINALTEIESESWNDTKGGV